MKKITKIFSLILIMICVIMISSCKDKSTSYACSTIYGKITKIDDTKITLVLLDTSNNQKGPMNPSGEEPPSKPDGDTTNPSGEETPPTPPDGNFNRGGNNGQMNNFTETKVTIIVDFAGASITRNNEIINLDEIKENDIIQIVFDESSNPTLVSLMTNNFGEKPEQEVQSN